MTERRRHSDEPTVVAPPGAPIFGAAPRRPGPPTNPGPPDLGPNPAYRPGVAQVGASRRPGPATETPATETTIVGRPAAAPRPPVRSQARQLRRGGEWSALGALFAFVCWGTWAISARGGSLAGPVLMLLLVLVVAVGLFGLCRLLGRVVLERSMGRVRRSAWPSHLVTGLFLAAAGVQYLRQVEWIVDGISWLRGMG
jgi:hypothetical protein